jgi:hypothetical protein
MPQKPIRLLPIPPPPPAQRVARDARFAAEGERRGRYHLPEQLDSGSPVGYRRRLSLTQAEADRAAALLSLEPPEAFVEGPGPTEQELFEEASLGVLSARQSTNYRGQRQTVLGPEDSRQLHLLLQRAGLPSLAGATHSLIGLHRPYWTPFTMLLTFVGHTALGSLATVPWRAWKKYSAEAVDIPTIGYLPDLHIGIWADATERAALLASGGRRRAHKRQRGAAGGEARAAERRAHAGAGGGHRLRQLARVVGVQHQHRRQTAAGEPGEERPVNPLRQDHRQAAVDAQAAEVRDGGEAARQIGERLVRQGERIAAAVHIGKAIIQRFTNRRLHKRHAQLFALGFVVVD